VHTHQFNIHGGNELTHNVEPLLHEIRHALERLIKTDETTTIDLRSIPLAPGEEETIVNHLGRGEVSVHLDALGPSEIYETRFSGVWFVTHYNENESVIGRFIEITEIPGILKAQSEDMSHAARRLREELHE
jgi:hydrogenase-1 operon protein HyaF